MYRGHFKKVEAPANGNVHFIKKYYEYSAHGSSCFSSSNENMLSRLQNSLALAVSQVKTGLLPKYIIVLLDDDLISFLNFKKEGVATLLGSWVEWLVQEFNTIIEDRLNQVPEKCKKVIPFFYWVTAPTHSYFSKDRNPLRIKFNLSLESVIRTQKNMRIVKIKEGWDSHDSHLVINDRMTESGVFAYWNAIDATFRFNSSRCDVFLAKQIAQRDHKDSPSKQFTKSHGSHRSDSKFDEAHTLVVSG